MCSSNTVNFLLSGCSSATPPVSTHSVVQPETATSTKDTPPISVLTTVSVSAIVSTPTSVSSSITTTSSTNLTSSTTSSTTISSISLPVSTSTSSTTTTTSTSLGVTMEMSKSNTCNSGINRVGKHKLQDKPEGEPMVKHPKPLNQVSGIHSLSNNHPLKKHSQSVRSKDPPVEIKNQLPVSLPSSLSVTITSSVSNSIPNLNSMLPKKLPPPYKPQLCYTPKTSYTPVINIPKVQATMCLSKAEPRPTSSGHVSTQPSPAASPKVGSKPKSPIGYKTLRDPPKTWNPQISRASLLKSATDPKYTDLKNVRPAKFFKLRNNMPR